MANSKYEYVKSFEKVDSLLPSTYIIIRIDGRAFHGVSKKYQFRKPNDDRALGLMNACAAAVLRELPDVMLAYGISDEFRDTTLFERRESKLTSTITSMFTAYYINLWQDFFPNINLSPPLPTFDGRAVVYPNIRTARDYLSWRQVDCHINNLYNTTFWALVDRGGLTETEAEARLNGTLAAEKNEILFSEFSINYNKEEEIYKKGTIIAREIKRESGIAPIVKNTSDDSATIKRSKSKSERSFKSHKGTVLATQHLDIIKDDFWDARPWLFGHPLP